MNLPNDPDDSEYRGAVQLEMRRISNEQIDTFEGYIAEIFSAFGLDFSTPATKDTPRRFIKELFDAAEVYGKDPAFSGRQISTKGRSCGSELYLISSEMGCTFSQIFRYY